MADDSMRVNLLLGVVACAVFLVFCLLIICARQCRSLGAADEDALYGYSIDMIDGRNLLLREDLADTALEEGKSEWQCVVCIHLNHPDHDKCALCGASADASLLNGSLLAANLSVLQPPVSRGAANSTVLLADAALVYANDIPMLRSSSGAAAAGAANLIDSIDLVGGARQRALRYRRLNQMQLTQKQRGASRRRLWQRVSLPNGAFVWVRTAHAAPVLQRSATSTATDQSLLAKLRNNSFLTKNPHANALRGTVAEQLHRKNAATMGFFTELGDDGAVAWRKTDAVVAVPVDAAAAADDDDDDQPERPPELDFEGLMSMPFREKKRWLLKKVTSVTTPYIESLHRVTVRRDHLLEDSVVALGGYLTPKQRREHINIAFVNEPALDAGGVLREWFSLVCRELFSAERGLFTTTHAENMSYWITPTPGGPTSKEKDDERLRYYTFAGRLFGKAIVEGLVFEATMALPLLKHFLGVPITFSDLEFLDEELYRSAVWIRDNDNVDALCVTFSVQTADGAVVIQMEITGFGFE
ncbi:hypothetical protein PybrP1_002743 [[Pythium] brassicae (nom. inval.)]|nr:hypothetical protein PybrP1_002743 [[Pythium] brassicae (nom. inval.)]